MTQFRKEPDALSNWFDDVLQGIGSRGSSFTDIDSLRVAALTHDGHSRRFLFQEFKRPQEECSFGQWWALYDLARQPNTTVWLVRQCENLAHVEWIAFKEVPCNGLLTAETISLDTYRERFAAWWQQAPPRERTDTIPPRVIWCEYVRHDPSLQAFIAGEHARDLLELHTARYERDHWRQVAERLHPTKPRASSRRDGIAEYVGVLVTQLRAEIERQLGIYKNALEKGWPHVRP